MSRQLVRLVPIGGWSARWNGDLLAGGERSPLPIDDEDVLAFEALEALHVRGMIVVRWAGVSGWEELQNPTVLAIDELPADGDLVARHSPAEKWVDTTCSDR